MKCVFSTHYQGSKNGYKFMMKLLCMVYSLLQWENYSRVWKLLQKNHFPRLNCKDNAYYWRRVGVHLKYPFENSSIHRYTLKRRGCTYFSNFMVIMFICWSLVAVRVHRPCAFIWLIEANFYQQIREIHYITYIHQYFYFIF